MARVLVFVCVYMLRSVSASGEQACPLKTMLPYVLFNQARS